MKFLNKQSNHRGFWIAQMLWACCLLTAFGLSAKGNEPTVLDAPNSVVTGCDVITINGGSGSINIQGMSAPIVAVQVFNASWVKVFDCSGNCSVPNQLIPNLAAGTYYVKVDLLNSNWTSLCAKEAYVTVLAGSSCSNVTSGGTIAGDQTICPNADPAAITSLSLPSGGSGQLEYMWLSSTTGCPQTSSNPVAGANAATYDPGVLAQTTWFLRCSKRSGCTDWTAGESNCVKITVDPNASCGGTGQPICNTVSVTGGAGNITIGNLIAPVVMVQVFNSGWTQVFSCSGNCQSPTLVVPSLAAGQYFVKVSFLNAQWQSICQKETYVTVGNNNPNPPTDPSITIGDVSVNENSGLANVVLTLSSAASTAVSVAYSTANGTAVSGNDFAASAGTAVFNAGQTTATISVAITDDANNEPTESFTVNLSNATGATIADNSATFTILDNDAATGGQPDCNNITVVQNGSGLTLGGLTAAITMVQVYNAGWASVFNQTYTTAPGSVSIPALANGTYFVKVDFLTAQWAAICKKEQYITVSGTPPQTPPVANNDNATTNQGTSVAISPLANDNLNGGTVQSLQIVANPIGGTVQVNGNVFQYTPNAGFNGNDQFTYRILGTNGNSNTAAVSVAVGQVRDKYRSYDGTANNLLNNKWGSAGIALAREMPGEYGPSDPKNAMGGQNRPNPRAISNLIANDPFDLFNERNLSAMMYTWGQFIDHDMDRTPTGAESAPVSLPVVEPIFTLPIPFKRSAALTGTGVTTNREQFNATTAWIDGSQVYGPNPATANWLRSFSGGKLKTSAGNLLPYNTTNGQPTGQIDPTAPRMDDDQNQTIKVPVAGDPRGNETPPLTSLHILFLREHNRICNRLISQGYSDDETIYQLARKEVGALIQIITYQQWLPSMGIQLGNYGGYLASAQPDILNSFATAGFRLGHTMVASDLILKDNNCNAVAPPFLLTDVFNNPQIIQQYGVDAVLKGISAEVMYEVDNRVNDQLRNFLGGAGAPGLDLASLNIQRGRDHGLPSYNKLRQHYTGTKAFQFSDISPIDSVAKALELLYVSVDNVDAWVGFLAEKHMANKSVGPCLEAILRNQFQKLRDGDYYYYLNDPYVANPASLQLTTLKDIIVRNTGLTSLASNVFYANPCPNLCGTVAFTPNVGPAQGSNITVYVNCDATYGKATWTLPTAYVTGATGPDCGQPEMTHNYVSGYNFPIGVTTVGYTAYYGLQKITRTFTVTVEKSAKTKILYLCNSLALNTADNLIKAKLEALGYLVEVFTDLGSGENYVNGHSCVLVSESCNNNYLGWLKTLVLPVVSMKASLLGNLAMSSNYGSNNYWSWDSYHCSIGSFGLWSWLFGGQTGNKKLFDFPFGSSHKITWGRPNLASCDFQTYVPSSTSDCRTFGYLKGKTMVNGYVAPHHRAAVCFGDNKAQYLNADGWMHLTNAVKWATDCANWNLTSTDNRSTDFSASKNGTATNLQWLSNTGDLNDFFVVERSANGLDFYQIATQDGKGAKGEMLYFNDADNQPLEGINYYRLKTLMRDGSSKFSDVKMVEFPIVDGISVYPNPARDRVYVAFDEIMELDGQIQLLNNMGKTVKTFDTPGAGRTFELNLDDVENGFYFLQIKLAGKRPTIEKLVVETAK